MFTCVKNFKKDRVSVPLFMLGKKRTEKRQKETSLCWYSKSHRFTHDRNEILRKRKPSCCRDYHILPSLRCMILVTGMWHTWVLHPPKRELRRKKRDRNTWSWWSFAREVMRSMYAPNLLPRDNALICRLSLLPLVRFVMRSVICMRNDHPLSIAIWNPSTFWSRMVPTNYVILVRQYLVMSTWEPRRQEPKRKKWFKRLLRKCFEHPKWWTCTWPRN